MCSGMRLMTTSSSDQRRRLSGHEHSLNGYGANADRTTLVTPFGARGSNPHGLKHRASCQYVVALFLRFQGLGMLEGTTCVAGSIPGRPQTSL